MTGPDTRLGDDDVVDQQRGVWAGVFQARNEALEDPDDVLVSPVVGALADQKRGRVLDWLWVEEAVLGVGHSVGELWREGFLALGEHVGVAVLHDALDVGVSLFEVSD